MILRVFALYNRAYLVLAGLMTLWTIQVIIASVGFSTGVAAKFPNHVIVGCLLSSDRHVFPAAWIAALVTATANFTLTIFRGAWGYWSSSTCETPLLRTLKRDGTLYFFVAFVANAINTTLFLAAVPSFRAFGATFTSSITSVMVSRLVLNLRAVAVSSAYKVSRGPSMVDSVLVRVLGELGNDTYDTELDASGTTEIRFIYHSRSERMTVDDE